MTTLDRIARMVGVSAADIVAAYPYGSRVYGTATRQSDHDFKVVCDKAHSHEEIRDGDFNVHVVTREDFQRSLDQHKVVPLECFFLPSEKVIKAARFSFRLDRSALRSELSAKASNSWVKAKKKFDVEGEPYIAKKSLWHAMRILRFGVQIATEGRITNYAEANADWPEIVQDPSTTWATYQARWQPVYNTLSSEFRKVAPK